MSTQAVDVAESSYERVYNNTTNQVDGNVAHKSKGNSKVLSKKRSKKKAKDMSVEVQQQKSEDDSSLDATPCLKADLSEGHYGTEATDMTSEKPHTGIEISDDEASPEGFSFTDARQQVMMKEEHMKQHLAKCVYAINLYTYTHLHEFIVCACVCVCMRMCVHAYVCACVRACLYCICVVVCMNVMC